MCADTLRPNVRSPARWRKLDLKPCEPLETAMNVAIGVDHRGFAIKADLISILRAAGCEVIDFGAHSDESVDYPDYAPSSARPSPPVRPTAASSSAAAASAPASPPTRFPAYAPARATTPIRPVRVSSTTT